MKITPLYRYLYLLPLWFISQAAAQEVLPTQSIFWQIEGRGLSKPAYLFGTHHLHDAAFVKRNKRIAEALESSDYVVGEIVIDTNQMQLASKMFSVMLMPNGKTLSSLLKPEEYTATDKCLRENLGLGLAAFNNVKPMFIYQLIMVSKYMKTQSTAPQRQNNLMGGNNMLGSSMDAYFQERGRELKKEIRGLESVDDQLKVLFDGYPLDRQIQILLEMVYDSSSTSTQSIVELTQLYSRQDLSALLTLMEKTTQPDELKTLLIDRNNLWIPQLDKVFQSKKSAFIAVGAGHLPGKYGVVHQLRQLGYTLSPIPIMVE